MASAVKKMPSSISSTSTEHRRNGSEAGPHGFTAVNITPPHSRGTHHESRMNSDRTNGRPESSATSPDISPRHAGSNPGRQNMYLTGHDQSPQHKRKRSMSSENALRSSPRYDYNPPKRTESHQLLADRALHVLDNANHASQHSNYYSTVPNGQDRQEYSYDQSYSAQNGVQDSTPDGRPTDQYQRTSSEQNYSNSSNGGDQHQQEESQKSRSSAVKTQQEAKRKRNFSNRTKTGCVTCRSRKKKCDERRPVCNNCERGGFECQGYNLTRSGQYTKHATPPTKPLLLQSKTDDEQPSYRESEVPASAHPNTAEVQQMRPNMAVDGHEQSRPSYVPNLPATADPRPPTYPAQPQHQPQAQTQPQWAQQPQHHQTPQHGPPPPPPAQQQPQPQPQPQPQLQHHHQLQHQSQHQHQHQLQHYPTEHLPPLTEVARPEQPPIYQQAPLPPHEYSTPHRDMSRPSTQSASNAPMSAMQTPQQQWQQPPPTHQHAPQPPPQAHPQPPPQSHQPPPQQEYGTRPNPYPPRINTAQPAYTGTNRLNTATATATANTASASYTSGWEQKGVSKVFSEEDVERSKMIRGASYSYFNPTLKNERQRCANALLRYNNACQLSSGVSEEAAHTMLEKVFKPAMDKTHAFIVAPRQEGLLGPGVIIEQGFKCTYGYNIRIFDNAFIGENTRIDDSGRVEVGARSWVGANVTILTNDVAKDAIQRKGTDGQLCFTKGVTIGPQVVIGTGAVIFPGVTIGAHATIEPFAIVKHTVGDHVTQKAAVGAQAGQPHGYDSGNMY